MGLQEIIRELKEQNKKLLKKNKKLREENEYLKEKGKDIIKSGKYSTGHQRYYCKHCGTYFMETKGTPLYRRRLSEEEITQICKLLVEKKWNPFHRKNNRAS